MTCGTKSQGCRTCTREDEDQRRRVRRDIELETRRQQQQAYAEDLQRVEDEIHHQRLVMKCDAEAKEQKTHAKAGAAGESQGDTVSDGGGGGGNKGEPQHYARAKARQRRWCLRGR